MLEEHFRRTLLLSDDSFSMFVTRPLSATLLGVTAALLLLLAAPALRRGRQTVFRG